MHTLAHTSSSRHDHSCSHRGGVVNAFRHPAVAVLARAGRADTHKLLPGDGLDRTVHAERCEASVALLSCPLQLNTPTSPPPVDDLELDDQHTQPGWRGRDAFIELKTIAMAENKAKAVSTRKQVLAVGAMGADAFILIVASTATEQFTV